MKKILLFLVLFIAMPYGIKALKSTNEKVVASNNTEHQTAKKTIIDSQPDECANVLGKIGGMVIAFLQILEKPNDKTNVYKNIKDMIENFFEVGRCVLRTGPVRSSNQEIDDLSDDEFIELLISYLRTDEGKLLIAYWKDLLANETNSFKSETCSNNS